jgi:UDP-3-O-[3-hydroxymyristoyl] glucosamine N-acyltransferase
VTRRLGDLAEHVGGRVVGASDREIRGVRSLGEAGPGDLSLLTHSRYRGEATGSAAGALLVAPGDRGEDWLAGAGRDLLVADDPAWALARILDLLHPRAAAPAGVHPTAVVAHDAVVAESAHVGPYAVVGGGSEIASGAEVHAHVVLGRNCKVGAGSVLHPHAVLYDDTEVGERSIVHAGVVLGADGFGYATRFEDGGGGEDGRPVHHKVPQVGRVVLGDEVEVGALSAVDRATLGETRIGDGTKIDNLVQVGHNVEVGRSCILCGQAGIAGSARLGDAVVLAGQSGVAGHLSVGDGVQVAAKSALLQGAESGRKMAGIPAVELSTWRRQSVALARLPGWGKKIKELERRLRRLEGSSAPEPEPAGTTSEEESR